MATHKTYREITNGDIKNIYAGHNSNPPKLASGFASRYFGTRLLQTLFSTHAKPTDAFQWNAKSEPLPRIAAGSAGPAFRTFGRGRVDEMTARLQRPAACSAAFARRHRSALAKAGGGGGEPDGTRRDGTMSATGYRAMLARVTGTHTHVSRMAAERDVNRIIREINGGAVPSHSVRSRRIRY